MENNIVKLGEMIKTKGKTPTSFFIGEVLSSKPLSISINQVALKKNLYINKSLLVCEESELETIFAETQDATDKDRLFKNFFESYILKAGDKVITYQDGLDFYVLAKVGEV